MAKKSVSALGGQEEQDDKYRAPALDKGLDILEILAEQSGGMTRTEIVREMGLSPSQIFRMLERLVARGYVARSEGGDRYSLTMKMFLLANRHPPTRRLIAQAQPLMDDFAREAGQACHLVVPEAGSGLIIAQASPKGHWEFRARVGGELDLYTTGSGLALIAFQAPERRLQALKHWGCRQPRGRLEKVLPHLDEVRAVGYRLGPSSYLVGVTDISVPIYDPGGEAIAVLTCAFIEHPTDRDSQARSKTLSKLLKLSAELSYAERA